MPNLSCGNPAEQKSSGGFAKGEEDRLFWPSRLETAATLKEGGLVSETLKEVILFFDSTTAIVLFTPAMMVIAILHEVRQRRQRGGR